MEAYWTGLAARVRAWLEERGLPQRDAVLLLPFVQQLPLARRAFGAGWAPRIETTRSLASALGPSPLAGPGQPSGDAATDTLLARQLLLERGLKPEDIPGGERGLRLLCARVVELTHSLIERAAQLPPIEREAWWVQVQQRFQIHQKSAPAWEGLLAQLALAWAQTAPAPASDRLFGHPAGAWILVEAGGPDPLARAVLRASGAPQLLLCADAAPRDWLVAASPRLHEQLADDAQDLASRCAMQLLAAPDSCTALIALDRSLVRQVLALLRPYGLRIQDETGATLSAQPAAAALMHLLRAALNGGMDDLLAWFKGPLAPPGLSAEAVDALEAWARRHAHANWRQALSLRSAPSLLGMARERLERLGGAPRSLRLWLQALRELFERGELEPRLKALPDGPALADALWLSRNPWPGSATEAALNQVRVAASDWLDWVDERLRAAASPACSVPNPQIVITPLARALLRPFDRVLLAGCDHRSMALGRVAPALLPERLAAELGLPNRELALQAQWESVCHLLRVPELLLLRAKSVGAEPLEPGWPLQRLTALGARSQDADDERPRQRFEAAPLAQRAAASLPGWLPETISARAAEALRTCPYRFFAQKRLGLSEPEELDRDPDARDWGIALHEMLAELHAEDFDPAAEGDARWDACAERLLAAREEGEALELAALLQRWRAPYLRWWTAVHAQGARVQQREWRLKQPVWTAAPLDGVHWEGVLDRIDAPPSRLLDYKTGSASGLKDRLRDPQEDTQLPFYAALLEAAGAPVEQAAYLAIDSSGELQTLAHPQLQQSARRLREGLGEDLLAIHQGTTLRALGEGAACVHCEMRGLCRRDDWTEGAA